MRVPRLGQRASLRELVDAELADRLEHAIARLVGVLHVHAGTCRPAPTARRAPPPRYRDAATAWALPGVTPPGNTAIRSARERSASSSRSQLQLTTPRRVRCRGSAVRLPPVSNRNRSSSRAAICATPIVRSRAAASSIASGSPSSRRHTSMTASTLDASTTKPGWTAAARSANRRTADIAIAVAASVPGFRAVQRAAPARAPRRRCRAAPGSSPGSCRLRAAQQQVVGQLGAAASTRCSQLSRTSSVDGPLRPSASRVRASRGVTGPVPPEIVRSLIPRPLATDCARSLGSSKGASVATWTPPGNRAARRSAVSLASRVLPAPPGPTRVTRRCSSSCFDRSLTASSRPTKLVSWLPVRWLTGVVRGVGSPRSTREVRCPQVLAGIDAELVGEQAPGLLVRRQRLGLPPGGVQRGHP